MVCSGLQLAYRVAARQTTSRMNVAKEWILRCFFRFLLQKKKNKFVGSNLNLLEILEEPVFLPISSNFELFANFNLIAVIFILLKSPRKHSFLLSRQIIDLFVSFSIIMTFRVQPRLRSNSGYVSSALTPEKSENSGIHPESESSGDVRARSESSGVVWSSAG